MRTMPPAKFGESLSVTVASLPASIRTGAAPSTNIAVSPFRLAMTGAALAAGTGSPNSKSSSTTLVPVNVSCTESMFFDCAFTVEMSYREGVVLLNELPATATPSRNSVSPKLLME